MTDIVIRQPSSNNGTPTDQGITSKNFNNPDQPGDNTSSAQKNDVDNTFVAPTLIGLGPLRNALMLIIKQRIRAFELISLCTGCEVKQILTLCILLFTSHPTHDSK